jgi:tetratricopeptide (TPR) repeat protein
MRKTTKIHPASTNVVALIVVVVLCLLAATFIWILISVQALLARSNQERAKAEQVVEQMTSDLRKRLQQLGHLEVLEQPLKELLPLYKEQSDDPEHERHRGTLSVLIGEIYLAQGKLEDALTSYDEGLKIRRALLDKHPGDTHCQVDVAESLSTIGDVYRGKGQPAEALSSFTESLIILKHLNDTLKEQTDMAVRYARCLYYIGDTLLILGKFADAQLRYDEGLSCLEEVFKGNSSAENRSALATGLCTQGDRLRAQGKNSRSIGKIQAERSTPKGTS